MFALMNFTSIIRLREGIQMSVRGWRGPIPDAYSSSFKSGKIGASKAQRRFWT